MNNKCCNFHKTKYQCNQCHKQLCSYHYFIDIINDQHFLLVCIHCLMKYNNNRLNLNLKNQIELEKDYFKNGLLSKIHSPITLF